MPWPVAFVSSTVKDLSEHRVKVAEACRDAQYAANTMEALKSENATPVAASLRMVDESDVFLGIYGWRYGYCPDNGQVSITEMEFNRAKASNKPFLGFIASGKHPIPDGHVDEPGFARERLAALKKSVREYRVIGEDFLSPDHLKYEVLAALTLHKGQLKSDQNQNRILADLSLADEDEAEAQHAERFQRIWSDVKKALAAAPAPAPKPKPQGL